MNNVYLCTVKLKQLIKYESRKDKAADNGTGT